MHIACAITTQFFFDFFWQFYTSKTLNYMMYRRLHLRIALYWLKYTIFYLKHIHVLLSELYPNFIALGTKHFSKKILKKTLKFYCFFLWVGFTCLKTTEALQEIIFLLPLSPQEFLYSFNWPQKNETLSWTCRHPAVLTWDP